MRRFAAAALIAAMSSTAAGQSPTRRPAPPPPAPAPAAPAEPQPARIDRNGVLVLVRSTLLALHHANQTGNYTVLRDLGAPGFQSNTAARLADIFASHRAQNLDLSGVAFLDPQLTRLPQIVQGGMMHMTGVFPSVPLQVNFELLFQPVEGRWRLFGLSVNVGQSGPSAPQAEAPPLAATTSPAAAASALPPSRPAGRSRSAVERDGPPGSSPSEGSTMAEPVPAVD